MFRRTMNPDDVNPFCNHPDVRPFIGSDPSRPFDKSDPFAPFDASALVLNPRNIALVAPNGCWFLQELEVGVYELHTMFLKDGRGADYFDLARAALRWMFAQTYCTEILTKCPDVNPAARMAAVKVGFRRRFRREDIWPAGGGVDFMALSIDDWAVREREAQAQGEWFHATLGQAFGHPPHPHDEAHDQAVGCAVMMMRAGLVDKGVAFYNRWAIFAGYPLFDHIGPNLVDIQTAILGIHGDEMGVVLARG